MAPGRSAAPLRLGPGETTRSVAEGIPTRSVGTREISSSVCPLCPLCLCGEPIRGFPMEINGVAIADTFAEAFPMTAARAIVTAETPAWAEVAGRAMSGYATSVIACDAEA